MNSLPNNLTFEHYIGLKESYSYNITLLCRYEEEYHQYKLRDIIDARRGQGFKGRFSNLIMRQIRFLRKYKNMLVGLSLILLLLFIYFCKHILLILGIGAFVVMIWYLFILNIHINIKNHEILVFEFVNDNNKIQGERCFRSLTKYSHESKIDFLISLTGKKPICSVKNPESYSEILSLIKEYTESNCPFMKAIMAFDSIEDTKFIKLI